MGAAAALAEGASLRARLEACPDSLPEQVRAWDATFCELVRQVRLHCTERGELLRLRGPREGELALERVPIHAARRLAPRRANCRDEHARRERLRSLRIGGGLGGVIAAWTLAVWGVLRPPLWSVAVVALGNSTLLSAFMVWRRWVRAQTQVVPVNV